MKNAHLEHCEDEILLSKKSTQQVIKFLKECNSTVSTKYDGAPALVFCTNPENGKAVMRSQENFHKVFTNGQVNHIESKDLNINQETLKSFGYDLNKLTGFVLDSDKKVIALRKPSKGGDIESLGLEGTNNYVNMWLQKNVYDNSIKFTQNYSYK